MLNVSFPTGSGTTEFHLAAIYIFEADSGYPLARYCREKRKGRKRERKGEKRREKRGEEKERKEERRGKKKERKEGRKWR